MDLAGIGTKIQIRIKVEIKIRAEIPTEDKESGLTITTTSEAETVAEATIAVEALHRTLDTHKDGTANPCNLSNYNHN